MQEAILCVQVRLWLGRSSLIMGVTVSEDDACASRVDTVLPMVTSFAIHQSLSEAD